MINFHYHGKADNKLIQTMNMSELNILYQKKYLIIWIFLQQLCTNFCTLFILIPSVITVSQEKGIHSFFLQKVSLPITESDTVFRLCTKMFVATQKSSFMGEITL